MKLKSTMLVAAVLAVGAIGAKGAETDVWFMLTDTGQKLPMLNVSSLIAPDNGTAFAVLMGDNTLYEGVTKVTFARGPHSGVGDIAADNAVSVLADPVSNTLSVVGAGGKTAVICDTKGRVMLSLALAADEKIDISGLAAGLYLLKVGEATVKFVKK